MTTQTAAPVDAVLEHLDGARRSGDGWSARCPAHADRSPSLTVAVGADGRVLLKCQAGCDTEAVVSALGLTMGDLFPAALRSNGSGRRIDRTYDYVDEIGNLLFQVVRYHPKDFRQRRPNGQGWTWKLGDTRRVLYRLPQVLAAVAAGDIIHITEGEKDAEALARAGVVATCNAGGAGKWNTTHSEALAGATVVVVQDRDDTGRAHARVVTASLTKVGCHVTVVEAAVGKDATDHLSAGRTVAELVPVDMPSDEPDEPDDPDDPGDDEPAEKATQSQRLVALAVGRYRFAMTTSGEPFAVARDGANLARMLRGGGDSLRAELARAHYQAHGKPPTASALADALLTLEGEAMTAPRETVALRVATHDGAVVIDLGDETGRAAVVGADGWRVVDRSPVLFRRTELTGALPVPVPGGTLDELAALLNVSDDTWPLVLGWLVAALLPDLPHPVLLLGGEHGTGKSTTEANLAGLVDPSPAQLRSMPRDPEQWAVAASGSWVVPLDNVSAITPWLSDAICRAVTGDGTVRRRLYSNDSLSVLAFRRVVMLSAIDTGALRGDLADRLLLVDLERIPPTGRRDDAELTAAYTDGLPRYVGALLTLTSEVLGVLPTVHLAERPRMADFARVLAAVDIVLGTTALGTYRGQSTRLAVEVIDSDPVAIAVRAMFDQAGEWVGTAGDLLDKLTPDRPPKGWPTSAQGMGAALRRAAPALRSVGITVEAPDRRQAGTGRRLWTLAAADEAGRERGPAHDAHEAHGAHKTAVTRDSPRDDPRAHVDDPTEKRTEIVTAAQPSDQGRHDPRDDCALRALRNRPPSTCDGDETDDETDDAPGFDPDDDNFELDF